MLVSAVTDATAMSCTFGHSLVKDFAVRYGNDGTRHCRMCELQVMRSFYDAEIRKIEGQGSRS